MSAKDLANEAEKTPRTITIGEGDDAVTLTVPEKWKRLKFLRCVNESDTYGALVAAFGDDQVVLLEDLDLSRDEFDTTIERLLEALSGMSAGN